MKAYFTRITHIIFPGFIISSIIGFIIGLIIFAYKLANEYVTKFNNNTYIYLKDHLYLLPLFIAFIIGMSFISVLITKKVPQAKGGGIPTSEGIIRGSFDFNWYLTLISTTFLSFFSYFIGLPLGCEGPSVEIGTAISCGFSKTFYKNHPTWLRYLMTGGASAAFAVATGAPITGVIFALEEIHKKFSPMILLVSLSSVISASIVAYFLSIKMDISFKMFNFIETETLPFSKYPLLILLGIIISLIAIVFNRLLVFFQYIISNKLKNFNKGIRRSICFTLVAIIGLFYIDILGGGHSLIVNITNKEYSTIILIVYLLLKLLLISLISKTGATGGMFIPILCIGALVGGLFGNILNNFGLEEYYILFVCAGMAAFMASSIECPLSGLVFSIEALSCYNNILPISLTIFFAYLVSKIANFTPVYDLVLEQKLKHDYHNRDFQVIEFNINIKDNSFAVGKQSRDLLLPANMILLGVKRENKDYHKMDNHGEKTLHKGDQLTFRCQSYSIEKTKNEVESFFGKQDSFKYITIQENKKTVA